MTIYAQIQNGQVVLPSPLQVPDGTPVRVELATASEEPETTPSGLSLLERMQSVVGIAEGLPADAARNVDHYLYDQPKQ